MSGGAARLGPIDHVAVVVRSIADSLPRYRDLFGLQAMSEPMEPPGQAVRVVFLPTGDADGPMIELIEPTDTESGVARFLVGRGEGLHHICLRSGDLPRDLAALAAADAELIDSQPRPGAHGEVVFIHPRTLNGVLWELLERSS
jgi:methylmalonyl-CoA/ethylmalonyl-CoA epimerase